MSMSVENSTIKILFGSWYQKATYSIRLCVIPSSHAQILPRHIRTQLQDNHRSGFRGGEISDIRSAFQHADVSSPYSRLYMYSVVGSSPTRGSSFLLGKVTALGVLCCFALFICLFDLACFFLLSHLSLKHVCPGNSADVCITILVKPKYNCCVCNNVVKVINKS